MDTRERILKFLQGRAISRKDYDEAKAQYELALEGASEELKAQAAAYLQSVANQSGNPRSNKHARHTGAEAYRIATDMLNGSFDLASVASPYNDETIRTRRGDYARASQIANKFMEANKEPQSNGSGTTGQYADIYNFVWNLGLSPIEEIGATRGSKVRSYATQLAKNIASAIKAEDSGKHVRGKVNDMREHLAGLQSILQSDTESPEAYNALIRIASNYDPDTTHWRNYFGNLLPGLDKKALARKRWTDDDYEFVDNFDFGNNALADLARQRGYIVATKGGQNYLIKSDYSGFADDAIDFNTDWRNGLEGTGYAIKNGQFISGDLNQAYSDANNPFSEALKQYVANQKNEDRAIWKNYNRFTDLSKFNIISDNAAALHGKSVADMSRYFDAEVPIVATVEGDNWNALKSKYGHTKVDSDKITYYWKDANGENKSGKYSDLVRSIGDKLNVKKDGETAGYTDWSSAEINLDQITPQTEDLWTKDINRYSLFGNFFSNNWYKQVNKNLWSLDKIDADLDIVKNPQGAARMLVQLWATDDSELTDEQKRIKNRWWNQYSTDAIYLIYDQLKKNPDLFKGDSRYADAWHAILKAYKNKLTSTSAQPTEIISSEKEGGILFAKEGTYVDLAGNEIVNPNSGEESNAARVRKMAEQKSREKNELDERAAKYGRTPYRQKAGETSWNSADTLRATALATDVAGLIAAIAGPATSGVGSAIAIGSGFVSMGQDLAADIMDDSVSAGRATKNALINSGLAVGAMFGAKAPKIIKSALKILPKAMMAAGAAGIAFDPEVHNTLLRMQEGKTMNAADWRNILMVLRTATGIATVGTVGAKAKKGSKAFDKKFAENLKDISVDSELKNNVKYVGAENGKKAIEVPKEVFDEVNTKLASAKEEKDATEALQLLTKTREEGGAGLSEADAKSIVESVAGKRGLKFWKKTPETQRLREATPEQIQELTGRDLIADARLRTIELIRRENQNRHSSRFMRNLETRTEGLNPALNQALAGTGYKNIRELVIGENAKLPAIRPSKVVDATKPITPEEYMRIGNEVAEEAVNARRAAETAEGIAAKEASLSKLLGQREKLSDIRTRLSEGEQAIKDTSEAAKSAKIESSIKLKEIDSKISLLNADVAEYRQILKEFASKASSVTKSGKAKTNSAVRLLVAQKEKDNALAEIRRLLNSSLAKKAVTTGEDGKLQLDKNVNLSKATEKSLKNKINDYNSKLEAYNKLARTKTGTSAAVKSVNTAAEAKKLEADALRLIKELELTRIEEEARVTKANTDRQAAVDAYKALRADLLKGKMNSSRKVSQRLNKLGNLNEGLIAQRTIELAEAKGRVKQAWTDAKNKGFAGSGRNIGGTDKAVRIKIDGSDTTIAAGTNTRSYTDIRNAEAAKNIALKGRPNAKLLSEADIQKLYPSNLRRNIRGAAYDPDANQLVIWKEGGLIDSKYSHLRK